MDATRHAELLSIFRAAHVAYEAARSAAHTAGNVRDELALRLLEAEGRGDSPAAEYIRATLAGDYEKTREIRAAHPTEYFCDWPLPAVTEQSEAVQ